MMSGSSKTISSSIFNIFSELRKEILIGQILAILGSLLSDFLQPLGNFTLYIFIFSCISVLTLVTLYVINKESRTKIFKYITAAITVFIISGLFFVNQDDNNNNKGVLAANFSSIREFQISIGMMEENINQIKESALRTEKLVESISETGSEISNQLEEINQSFSSIAKLGGLVANPQGPQEFYNNARVYENRGDYLNARKMYLKYFIYELDFIDPHLRFQNFLIIQEGRVSTREIYNNFFEANQGTVFNFVNILLLPPLQRKDQLQDFINVNPNFAPAYYELSKEYSPARTGKDTLANRRMELENLESFFELNNKGNFLKYFLDQGVAITWIENAKKRLQILNAGLNEVKEEYFADGSIFKQTSFKNGKKHGKEITYSSNMSQIYVFDGKVKNHLFYGENILIDVNSIPGYEDDSIPIIETFYENGKELYWKEITYYKSGQIFSVITYPTTEHDFPKYLYYNDYFDSPKHLQITSLANGKNYYANGPYEYYYENGLKEERGNFKMGIRANFAFFYEDGSIESEGSQVGMFYRPYPWISSFTKQEHLFIKNDGDFIKYHPNGAVQLEGKFKDGVFQAPYKVYFDDGAIFLEKDTSGAYREYDRSGNLVLKLTPKACKSKELTEYQKLVKDGKAFLVSVLARGPNKSDVYLKLNDEEIQIEQLEKVLYENPNQDVFIKVDSSYYFADEFYDEVLLLEAGKIFFANRKGLVKRIYNDTRKRWQYIFRGGFAKFPGNSIWIDGNRYLQEKLNVADLGATKYTLEDEAEWYLSTNGIDPRFFDREDTHEACYSKELFNKKNYGDELDEIYASHALLIEELKNNYERNSDLSHRGQLEDFPILNKESSSNCLQPLKICNQFINNYGKSFLSN